MPAKPKKPVIIHETQGSVNRDGDMFRTFETDHGYHVSIRISPDSGFPQSEHCDCPAFKFSRDRNCKHVQAALELMTQLENSRAEAEGDDYRPLWES